MEKIRIGVVGAGLIWKRAHRPALASLTERVELTAFAEASEEARREIERAYPGVPVFSDYHELITSREVDWVLVLTPIVLNAPVALAAMRAGKDVIMEKPMARTLAEGEALVRLANEAGRRLYVLEQEGYASTFGMVADVIGSGEIGEVMAYDMVAHEIYDATPDHSAGGYGTTPWRIAPDFPLGTLFDGGHHPIARLTRLFGRPSSVYASGRQVRPTYGEFDHVVMVFQYDSGMLGTFSYATVLSGQRNYLHIRGTKAILSVERDGIAIVADGGDRRPLELRPERTYDAMWRAILDAIAEGRDPSYTKERAFQDLSILFAIQRSIQAGAKVCV